MGGNKKGQRTKGNTRPSNSGRIAELLSASGAPVNCFVGFGGVSAVTAETVATSSSSTSTFFDDSEQSLDNDLKMLMKKMTKKDAVTKLKSIQEFTDVLKQKDDTLMKSLLPHWPRLYTKIAMDSDWRVREASHRAHQQLVLKARRNLAPHLRALMGVWLISQCDPYAPAASAALSAFKSAFPLPEKQSEAFAFCKTDVVHFIEDMLFQQTAQTLSDPKFSTPEEMESKYNRLMSCCLEGLSILISSLSEKHRAELTDSLRKIAENDKFWKFRKNKDLRVQASWFKLITCMCKYTPDVLSSQAAKVSQATLGYINVCEPILVQPVWESILSALVSIPDLWQHMNLKKHILPQFWKVLKEGGKGNAVVIFPHVLPLLSQFPSDIMDEPFYDEFFACLRQGMLEPRVLSSTSELNAIVQAFLECARFVLLKRVEPSENTSQIQKLIIVNNLLSLLQTSINEKQSRIPFTVYYSGLSELVHYIGNQICVNESEEKRSEFEKMLSLFWETFFEICSGFLVSETAPDEWKLERLTDFFHALHHLGPSAITSKSNIRVHFKDDPNELPETKSSAISNPKDQDLVTKSPSYQQVLKSTHKLCVFLFEKLLQKVQLPYLKLLAEIIKCAPSEELFILLCARKNSEGSSLHCFFDDFLYPWLLKEKPSNIKEQQLFVRFVVDIACVLIKFVDKHTAEDMFGRLCQLNDPQIIQHLVEKGLQAKPDTNLTSWLKSSEAGQIIVRMAHQLLKISLSNASDDSDRAIKYIWKTLQLCFQNLDDRPVVSLSCIEEVLNIFQDGLVKNSSTTGLIEFSCELALRLFTSYPACWEMQSTEELLLALFSVSSQCSSASGNLQTKVEEAWQVGVKHLIKAKGGFLNNNGFFVKCANNLQERLSSQLKTKTAVQLFVNTVVKLLTTIYETVPCLEEENTNILSEPTILSLLNIILLTEDQWQNVEKIVLSDCALHSSLKGKHLFITLSDCLTSNEVICNESTVLQPSFATIDIFCTLLNWWLSLQHMPEPDNGKHETVSIDMKNELMLKHIPHALLVCSYYKNMGYLKPGKKTNAEERKNILEAFVSNITYCLTAMSTKLRTDLMEIMLNNASQVGQAWILALDLTMDILTPIMPYECLCRSGSFIQNILPSCNTIEKIQTVQCILPLASSETKSSVATMAINMLLCSEEYLAADGTLGYLSLLSSCLNVLDRDAMDNIKEDVAAVMEYISSLKKTHPNYFACDEDLKNCDIQILIFCSQILNFLRTVLNYFCTILTPDSWDFILCTLTSWVEGLHKNKEAIHERIALTHFAYQSFLLVEKIGSIVKSIPTHPNKEIFPPSLSEEWTEFFSSHIYQALLPMFVYLTGLKHNSCKVLVCNTLMEALSSTMKHTSLDHILKMEIEGSGDGEAAEENAVQLPAQINNILKSLCPLLINDAYSVQLGAHSLLQQVMPILPENITDQETDGNELKESVAPPPSILKILKETNIVVDTMLMEFTIGNCCIVKPDTDSYTYTSGYLLIWMELLEFFSKSSSEERSKYATYFRESGMLSSLLLNLFRLMPVINLVLHDKTSSKDTDLTALPSLDPSNSATSTQLQHLACYVYLMTLRKLPALVRHWWMNLDKVTADIVNKYTSRFFSSFICSEEIGAVQNAGKDFVNMTVLARPIAREVVATYTIDDATIELVIQLPTNHPLGSINVESQKKVKVGNAQWRNWMLQLTTFLTHQNGSILDALTLWKKNVDKKFEGVEECMICFSVLHGATCQLPRLMCRTCRKKFHSFCLYKWFSTSNNSTCPLCRNIF